MDFNNFISQKKEMTEVSSIFLYEEYRLKKT